MSTHINEEALTLNGLISDALESFDKEAAASSHPLGCG